MDEPSSMIIPDDEQEPGVMCSQCWSRQVALYGGEYQGILAVMAVCSNCGARSLHPLLEMPQASEENENG